MANKTKQSNNQESVYTSTRTSRSSTRLNNSINQILPSRLQEKKDLQDLNDRLANYFSKVRDLENDKINLQEQLKNEKDANTKKLNDFKFYYEKQLEEQSKKLDFESTEKAKIILDYEKLKNTVKDLEKQNHGLSINVNSLDKKNTELFNENERLKKEMISNKSVLKVLEDQVKTLSKSQKLSSAQIEQETIKNVTLENQIKQYKEQLDGQKVLYEQQLEDHKNRLQEEIDNEVERVLRIELDYYITEETRRLKKESDEEKLKFKLDLEEKYQNELNYLEDELSKKNSCEKEVKNQVIALQALNDKLSAKLNNYIEVENNLNAKIQTLEGKLEVERNLKSSLLKEKESDLKELEEVIKLKETECQNVLDNNILLNEEIKVYRTLLEEQEKNHSLDADGLANSQNQKGNKLLTPNRRIIVPRKRRRVYEEEENVIDIQVLVNGDGPVIISDFDQEGKNVVLKNRSNEDVPLGNWEVKRLVSDNIINFKFHRSIVIKANSNITIWSIDAGVKHDPPSNIVMKANWIVGDEILTILEDSTGKEVASKKTVKTFKKTKKRYSDGINGVAKEADKCFLM